MNLTNWKQKKGVRFGGVKYGQNGFGNGRFPAH